MILSFLFYFLGIFKDRFDLQFDERIGSFEGAVLDGWNLIASQVYLEQVGQVAEQAVRLDPDDLIIVQDPVGSQTRHFGQHTCPTVIGHNNDRTARERN